jgi:hypothetical protein
MYRRQAEKEEKTGRQEARERGVVKGTYSIKQYLVQKEPLLLN